MKNCAIVFILLTFAKVTESLQKNPYLEQEQGICTVFDMLNWNKWIYKAMNSLLISSTK